jgi:hypothetical protein
MTWVDLLGTLAMLGSVLATLGALVWMLVCAGLGRWGRLRATARRLGVFVGCYVLALGAVGLATPRRVLAPGVRRCFDDWCVAGLDARPLDSAHAVCGVEAGTRQWAVTLEVSSDARRVRQRARDAAAVLEDGAGRRYRPCAAALTAHELPDELGPGESFRVVEPFRLPAAAAPAGAIVHHGAFPGIMIIGDDQGFLHAPALLEVAAGG